MTQNKNFCGDCPACNFVRDTLAFSWINKSETELRLANPCQKVRR